MTSPGHPLEVRPQRLGDDDRLLVDLLEHEVGVVALVDRLGERARVDDRPVDAVICLVVDLDRLAADRRPVALVEIGDAPRQRGQRMGVGADEVFARAVADRQRRTEARGDQQVGFGPEQHGEGERAVEPRQDGGDGVARGAARLELAVDQVGDDLGVGLALEGAALGEQLVAQRLEVLDDAVVDDRHVADDVGVGVILGRPAVRRPASVGDAGRARQRVVGEPRGEVGELARCAPTIDDPVVDGGDAGAVVAAVFEPLQPVEQPLGDVAFTQNADDAAHMPSSCAGGIAGRGFTGNEPSRQPQTRAGPMSRWRWSRCAAL